MALMDNLIFYYKMDDEIGSLYAEDSAWGNSAIVNTLNGTPIFQPSTGKVSGSCNLNRGFLSPTGGGLPSYMLSLSGSFTFTMWVKPQTSDNVGDANVLNCMPLWQFYFHESGIANRSYPIILRYGKGNDGQVDVVSVGGSSSPYTYHNTTWTFVAITWDHPTGTIEGWMVQEGSSSFNYYYQHQFDGIAGTHYPPFTASISPPTLVTIGGGNDGIWVDEVMAWNRVLRKAEIDFIYNSGSGVSLDTSGPMIYLMDQNKLEITKLVELSGNTSASLNRVGYLSLKGEVIENPLLDKEFRITTTGNLHVRKLTERWI